MFVAKGQIDNNSALVQMMAWHRTGDKLLSQPMMAYVGDANMRRSASMSWYIFKQMALSSQI